MQAKRSLPSASMGAMQLHNCEMLQVLASQDASPARAAMVARLRSLG
jgi:hypothetical protein